jgi:hypothetical protein
MEQNIDFVFKKQTDFGIIEKPNIHLVLKLEIFAFRYYQMVVVH